MKFVLYITGYKSKDEYLVREDGQLVAHNKLNPLERSIALRKVSPRGDIEPIKSPLNIPVDNRICFYREGEATKENVEDACNTIITTPITSFTPLEKVEEYLNS